MPTISEVPEGLEEGETQPGSSHLNSHVFMTKKAAGGNHSYNVAFASRHFVILEVASW